LASATSASEDVQEFYQALGIPLFNDKPCLLLHNFANIQPNGEMLFNGKHSEGLMVELVEVLTSFRIFCNASGAGKTRLLLEGYAPLGFYFVAAKGTE